MNEGGEKFSLKDLSPQGSDQNTFFGENNHTKMTKTELVKETGYTIHDYDCPSLKCNRVSYSSSDDEDFNSAINYCREKDTSIKCMENYASAPNNTDKLGLGASTPDVRRNSIGSIDFYKTENFDLTYRSLPDNGSSLIFSNEMKAINKVGPNCKIQKNDNTLPHQRRTSSIGLDVIPSQSAFKNKRIHSTMSTCSRTSMHFSRHF